MKKLILGFSTLCLIAFTSCKEDAAKKVNETNVAEAAIRDAESSKFPVLNFETSEFDFGEIKKGSPVETVFNYKNTGAAPLVITNIGTTCGCTVPKDWSREPLLPTFYINVCCCVFLHDCTTNETCKKRKKVC